VALAGRRTVGAGTGAAGATVEEPLARWRVRADEPALELEFEALTPPAELPGRHAAAKAGGLEGYEQLCRVRGTARVDGRDRPVRGLGQREHAWGNPDWERIALTRSVGAWLGDGTGVVLAAVRPEGVAVHAGEAIWAAALDGSRARAVDDARLSTTMDAAGRQIRAGLELWLEKSDDYPFRGTGEVVAGSTLELGALRLDVAFFRWHIEGHTGSGRYDVIRRAA
jgi:predicted secreted hydrolase